MSCAKFYGQMGDPCKKSIAGIEELYIVPKGYVYYYHTSSFGNNLDIAVDAIFTERPFINGKVEFVKDSASVVVNSTYNSEINNRTFTTEIKFRIIDGTFGTFADYYGDDYVILFKDEYGKYHILGLNGTTQVDYNLNTGEKLGDFAGQEFTITAEERPLIVMDKELYDMYGNEWYINTKKLINISCLESSMSGEFLSPEEGRINWNHSNMYFEETYADNEGYHLVYSSNYVTQEIDNNWLTLLNAPFPNLNDHYLKYEYEDTDGLSFTNPVLRGDKGETIDDFVMIKHLGDTINVNNGKKIQQRTLTHSFKIPMVASGGYIDNFNIRYTNNYTIGGVTFDENKMFPNEKNSNAILVDGYITFTLKLDKNNRTKVLSMELCIKSITLFNASSLY